MSNIFGNKLKSLREKKQVPQRKIASILDIDTATYCKIEKGSRRARREQIYRLADFFEIELKELIRLWSADKICQIVANEEDASQILDVVTENIHYYGHQKTKL